MSSSVPRAAALCLALPALAGCSKEPAVAGAPESAAAVYTTFYPSAYFAERIAGGAVPVVCPLPAGEDPAFWQPPDDVLAAYQTASLIVVNGAGFERWVEGASLPESRLVDASAPFRDAWLAVESVTHSHGGQGQHTHEGFDGHTWMDPLQAKAQAQAIRDGLARAFPAHAEQFERNFRALAADLDALDRELADLAPRLSAVRFVASHPSYGYPARRYAWDVHDLVLDPEALPSEEDLAHLTELAAGGRTTFVLWEEEPLSEVEAALAALGIGNVVFAPCESLHPDRRRAGEDYLSVMRANVARLTAAAP